MILNIKKKTHKEHVTNISPLSTTFFFFFLIGKGKGNKRGNII